MNHTKFLILRNLFSLKHLKALEIKISKNCFKYLLVLAFISFFFTPNVKGFINTNEIDRSVKQNIQFKINSSSYKDFNNENYILSGFNDKISFYISSASFSKSSFMKSNTSNIEKGLLENNMSYGANNTLQNNVSFLDICMISSRSNGNYLFDRRAFARSRQTLGSLLGIIGLAGIYYGADIENAPLIAMSAATIVFGFILFIY